MNPADVILIASNPADLVGVLPWIVGCSFAVAVGAVLAGVRR